MKKMLKKLINIILSLGLLLQNFAFITPVFADTDNLELEIKSITQNNRELVKEGDIYVANELSEIGVRIGLTQITSDNYWIEIVNGNDSHFYYYSDYSTYYPQVDYTKEINDYTVNLCTFDDNNCDNPLSSMTFKVRFTRYMEVANGKIYLDSVTQGGKSVELENDTFYLNDVQSITFHIKGENLIDDGEYLIYARNGVEYTGSELESGIDLIYNPEDGDIYGISYEAFGMHNYIKYKHNEEYEDVYYSFYSDSDISNYQMELLYTNNKSTPIDEIEFNYYDSKKIIRKKYHNSTNTLTYRLSGYNFKDKTYPVNVVVYGDDTKIYDKTFNINGDLLNEGYDLELIDLNLGSSIYGNYTFDVTIDSNKKTQSFGYDSYNINIKSISQKGKNLEKINNIYQAPGFSDLYANIEVENYNPSNRYTLVVSYNGMRSSSIFDPNDGERLSLDIDKKESNFKLYLCDGHECDKFYGETEINVSLTNFEALEDGKIYLTKIMQGDKKVNIDNNKEFHLNSKQDAIFYFKGENLIKDLEYTIRLGGYASYESFTGDELEKGVSVAFYTSENKNSLDYFNIGLTVDDANIDNYCYQDGTNNYCTNDNYFNYVFDKIEDIPTFTGMIKYTNYLDKEIKPANNYINNYLILDSNYHNSNNTLTYMIEGNNFKNENYTVSLVVKRNDEDYFTKNYTVNGLLLNDGYNLELSGLTLDKWTTTDILYNTYDISISISGITKSNSYIYNSLGKQVYTSADLYRDENKTGVINATSGIDSGETVYAVSDGIFSNNGKLGILFKGYNYNESDNYSYNIEYGYTNLENEKSFATYVDSIKSGNISGNTLINDGIKIMVDNPNNYKSPAYRVVIKKGNEILSTDGVVLSLENSPSIIETVVKADNQTLQLDNNYSIPVLSGKDINITLYGVGFENKNYEFNVCSTGMNSDYSYSDQECIKKTINGNDINNGNASFTISHDSLNYKRFNVEINTTSYELANTVYCSFVYYNEGDYILNADEIGIVDDIIINYISRGIDVKSILDMITFAPNYSGKMFDKTGMNEVSGTVKTGMILKVFNNNNQVVQSLVIAVRGDLSGDGKMSITDVVKAKRHVAGVELLTGAYKEAGNLMDTGDISLTDLINLARGVAGIEEVW